MDDSSKGELIFNGDQAGRGSDPPLDRSGARYSCHDEMRGIPLWPFDETVLGASSDVVILGTPFDTGVLDASSDEIVPDASSDEGVLDATSDKVFLGAPIGPTNFCFRQGTHFRFLFCELGGGISHLSTG
ncbi:hypothetical protein ACH5RR_029708 [Cinchona calisaya]|uniref:Agmatinase n=1 Tax=Cinchona calisaya TaxID=153742 RepID=A0ABD2YVR6_9GENT